MKKIISVALALTVTASLAACGAKEPEAQDSDPTDTPIAQMRNPIHYGSAEEVLASTGILLTAPANAADVKFSSIDTDPATAQMDFTLNGVRCNYRVVPSAERKDISGMHYTWKNNAELNTADRTAELHWFEGEQGIIFWLDEAPGLLYSLSMDSGASQQALKDLAALLFAPVQGNAEGDEAAFARDFSALLTEFCESIRPGTTGVSLRYAAFAAKLADLFTKVAPTSEAVSATVEGFAETLDGDELADFPLLMNSTLTMFRELTGEHGGDLLSACGCTPETEWDAEALEPLFRVMSMAAPWEDCYAGILEQYASALKNGDDRQTMRDNDLNDLAADLGDTPLETLGYLVDDLDGNGVRELVIGTISDNDFLHALILDLYTLDESGAPRLLFRSRERDRLYSVGDRIFANFGSSGANDSVNRAFILEDGSLNPAEGSIDPNEYTQLDLLPFSNW